MALFSDIIGQEHIKKHLQDAIVSRMASHAYIIQGEEGMEKSLVAEAFANGLLCERGEAEPCLECHSCKQYLSKNHPDIKVLVPEKSNVIRVNEVRTQIINDVDIKPYSSDYKIYIIPDAQRMNAQAQNALLKTLEEPPEYVVILLLCTSETLLLDTIISRCVTLCLRPLKNEVVCDYLIKKLEIPDYKAAAIAAFARGSIGRALQLAQDKQFDAIRALASEVLRGAKSWDMKGILDAVGSITSLNTRPEEFLDYLILWYRDVLVYKSTQNVNSLLFKEDIRLITEIAAASSFEGIERIIGAINDARDRLRVNVNKELTIELVLLAIKES